MGKQFTYIAWQINNMTLMWEILMRLVKTNLMSSSLSGKLKKAIFS